MKMHLALKALLLGVLVGCAVPYGIFTWASGIDDMIELGLLPDEGHVTVTLLREPWTVPDAIPVEGQVGGIRPFAAGETLAWQVAAA